MSKKDVLSQVAQAEAAQKQKEQQQSLQETIDHLRAQITEKDRILRKYSESRGGQIELAREICSAVKAVSPYPRQPIKAQNTSSSDIPVVINISDWHIGEIIRPAETGGFGAFNFAIAEKRAAKYVENILAWTELHRRAYNIQDAHVFGIGDYISGNIHQELLVSNEFPFPVQIAKAGALISQTVRSLLPHFRKITFHGVGADNHGRLQPKPQAKGKALNNASFLVHSLIESYLGSHKNFSLIHYEDMAPVIEVAHHNFLVTHGDIVKSWQGVPWYGWERWMAREAVRRMGRKEYHFVNGAHFHTPGFLFRLLLNGSLNGSSEYDASCGRYAPPSQITYLVHPRWAVFDFVAWKFEVEQTETDARRK